jgi:hypothetical protein
MWDVHVLRIRGQSETHRTYTGLQLDQIRDTPIFLLKQDERS